MYWTSLAAELRSMILEALSHENNVAHCASVCQEWQAAIEKSNFHSLKLTARDVPVLKLMAARNLRLIRYIWYSIELRNYDCTECDLDETEDIMDANRATVEDGIRVMFCALSERPPNENMTLDISIHSPSDSQHHFKYIRFEPANTLSSRPPLESAPHHGLVHSSSAPLPSIAAIDRIFPDIDFLENESDFWTSVPRVPCVTHLLMRRQTRRRWDPIALSRLIACLPNLQDMCFEPWREWIRWNQARTDIRSKQFYKSLIPNNLKKMVIFEDLNEMYISANSTTGLHDFVDAEPVRTASRQVTKELAEASLGLQHLCAAFIIDASLFWEVRQPSWAWEQLLTLAITSRHLTPQEKPRDINELIHLGAQATRKMPKLQIMELWNGGKGHAAVFRYKSMKAGGSASIAWRGTWEMKFETKVVTAWENVAEASYAGGLRIQNEVLRPSQIRSHGEAVLILELETEVACPVSIQQIHREHLQTTT